MRYLLFVSCLVYLLACRSPYKNLQRSAGDVECLEKFRPLFSTALYNTKVNVIGRHLSGLLLLKQMPDSSIRIVFSSEMGIKFFDFEFSRKGDFKVYYILKQMNKKAVLKTLRKDFEMILMLNMAKESAYVNTDAQNKYYAFPQGKEINYYITDGGCNELVRIEKVSKRKIKVQAIMQRFINGVPDTIGITHRNFNFNIGLKRLER